MYYERMTYLVGNKYLKIKNVSDTEPKERAKEDLSFIIQERERRTGTNWRRNLGHHVSMSH